jgi:hypothetical protein
MKKSKKIFKIKEELLFRGLKHERENESLGISRGVGS